MFGPQKNRSLERVENFEPAPSSPISSIIQWVEVKNSDIWDGFSKH